MATFIMLSRLNPEGMRTLRDNPQCIQEVNREVEEFGARVVQQYALLGSHDFTTVLEAPDAETVSRVSVELSSRATASYETLPAIDVEAFVARLRGEGGRAQVGTEVHRRAFRRQREAYGKSCIRAATEGAGRGGPGRHKGRHKKGRWSKEENRRRLPTYGRGFTARTRKSWAAGDGAGR